MNPLYNTGIQLYKGAAKLAACRSPKVAEMLRGQRHTLAELEQICRAVAPEGFDLWIHAASLGEFEQGRPLIERYRAAFPERKILLSFFSPSGYRVRCKYPAVDAVVYLPFDTPSAAARFLDAARPRTAIFVKYEFWGNYLEQLSRRDIPTYIISAIFRPSQRFFRRGGGVFRKMLRNFTRLYVQDEASRGLLASIGIDRVTVAGDTRFDRVADIRKAARTIPEAERFLTPRPALCLVAGSTWPADEDILVPWFNEHPEVKAIVAPHEFNPARLRALAERLSPGVQLLSELQAGKPLEPSTRIVLVDCFGLLSSLYAYGDVAYVGGGFGAGIHNINEAAVYGIPVIFGPNNRKFKEAADLIALGAGFQIDTARQGHELLDRLLSDTAARRRAGEAAAHYISDNLGATDRIFNDLFKS